MAADLPLWAISVLREQGIDPDDVENFAVDQSDGRLHIQIVLRPKLPSNVEITIVKPGS